MIQEFIILTLSIFSSLGVTATEIYSPNDVINFINQNISILRDEYSEAFGEEWNLNYYVSNIELYDRNDELSAFMIVFDNGYLTVGTDLNLYEIETEGVPPLIDITSRNYLIGNNYYIKVDDVFVPNTLSAPRLDTVDIQSLFDGSGIYKSLNANNTGALTNFKITNSIADDLSDYNGQKGKYKIYTRNQGPYNDCGAQAAINLLYTYELSGISNITKSRNSDNELNAMRAFMNWTPEGRYYLVTTFYGIWPSEIVAGMEEYLPSKYMVLSGDFDFADLPVIGLYYNANVVSTAHNAVIIGSAQSDAWWIFKTNFDIISTWFENYTHISGVIGTKKPATPSYYYVESAYRQNVFMIEVSTGAKWYEFKPLWTPLAI